MICFWKTENGFTYNHVLTVTLRWYFFHKPCTKYDFIKILITISNSITFQKNKRSNKTHITSSHCKRKFEKWGVYINGWYYNSVPFALTSPLVFKYVPVCGKFLGDYKENSFPWIYDFPIALKRRIIAHGWNIIARSTAHEVLPRAAALCKMFSDFHGCLCFSQDIICYTKVKLDPLRFQKALKIKQGLKDCLKY